MPGGQARRVPLVGLTGGLGAGKSTALALLADMGAATLSTDLVVHELYETAAVRDAVVAKFGAELAPGGIVDRSLVAAKIFSDDESRHWVEQLLWPLVGQRIQEFCHEALDDDPPPRAVVVETPLLFEAGLQSQYDKTVVVVAQDELRAARAQGRGHSELAARNSRQLSQAEKQVMADYTIRNDGSVDELKSALADLLAKLEKSVP